MKTDQLIKMLATEPRGLTPVLPWSRLAFGLIAGLAASALLMVLWLGVNEDLIEDMSVPMFWVKVSFGLALAATTFAVVKRLARPGVRLSTPAELFARVIVLALWIFGFVFWLNTPSLERPEVVMGQSWSQCPYNIAALSLPIFVATFWALRHFAPTQLMRAGGIAGVFSGAAAAFIYALHCTEYSPTFVALWYSLGIAIPGVIGMVLGRWLLRW
jgi:hypothetical protein